MRPIATTLLDADEAVAALRPATGAMRAALIAAPGRVEVREAPIPEPAAGEVRIRIEGCGVCASNIPPWEGREWFSYPLRPGQLGHEGWGAVDAAGEGVTQLRRGDRVAFLSDHAYAEYDVAPQEKVAFLPPSLGQTPFPGEPLGCAMNILARSEIRPGQTVAIVGIGFLGAMLTRLATNAGARVIAVARRQFAQEVARDMGAGSVVPMDDHHRIIEQVRLLTRGRFCDVVIEAVGKEWPINLSAELTKERGRLVIAGYHQDGMRSINMQLWNWRGLDVINAHERDPDIYMHGIRSAIEAVEKRVLDPVPLLTHAYRLEELGAALEATKARPNGFLKAWIRM